MGTESGRVLVGGNQKFEKRGGGPARTHQPGTARGPDAREGGGGRQVNGAHAAPTRPERPGGRRPRSHSVNSHRGPQRRSLDPFLPTSSPGPVLPKPTPPAPSQVALIAQLTNCPGVKCRADRTETTTPPPPPPDVTSERAGRGWMPRRR